MLVGILRAVSFGRGSLRVGILGEGEGVGDSVLVLTEEQEMMSVGRLGSKWGR
jgi:hypothetical protein